MQRTAVYWEHCEHCHTDTPHRFISREGLCWTFQCRICGTKKTTGLKKEVREHGAA